MFNRVSCFNALRLSINPARANCELRVCGLLRTIEVDRELAAIPNLNLVGCASSIACDELRFVLNEILNRDLLRAVHRLEAQRDHIEPVDHIERLIADNEQKSKTPRKGGVSNVVICSVSAENSRKRSLSERTERRLYRGEIGLYYSESSANSSEGVQTRMGEFLK